MPSHLPSAMLILAFPPCLSWLLAFSLILMPTFWYGHIASQGPCSSVTPCILRGCFHVVLDPLYDTPLFGSSTLRIQLQAYSPEQTSRKPYETSPAADKVEDTLPILNANCESIGNQMGRRQSCPTCVGQRCFFFHIKPSRQNAPSHEYIFRGNTDNSVYLLSALGSCHYRTDYLKFYSNY